jgi:hypothetical protein
MKYVLKSVRGRGTARVDKLFVRICVCKQTKNENVPDLLNFLFTKRSETYLEKYCGSVSTALIIQVAKKIHKLVQKLLLFFYIIGC